MHVRTRHRDKYKGIKIYLKGINNASLALIRHKAEKAAKWKKAKKPKKSRNQKSHEAKKAKKPKKSRSQKSHKAKNATKPKSHKAKNAASFFTEFLVGIVKLLIFLYIHDVATIWIYFSQKKPGICTQIIIILC